MEQLVRVRNVFPDGTAEVLLVRESACSGDCHKCSGCGAAQEAMTLTVRNPIGAGVGDLVEIEAQTGPVLAAAAVLYMLPLLLHRLFLYGQVLKLLPVPLIRHHILHSEFLLLSLLRYKSVQLLHLLLLYDQELLSLPVQ